MVDKTEKESSPLPEFHKSGSEASGTDEKEERVGTRAVAFGPNDECVQIGGTAFTVNISAQLVADKINASIQRVLQKKEASEHSTHVLQVALEALTLSDEAMRQALSYLVMPVDVEARLAKEKIVETLPFVKRAQRRLQDARAASDG
jgi:hypothetical protein